MTRVGFLLTALALALGTFVGARLALWLVMGWRGAGATRCLATYSHGPGWQWAQCLRVDGHAGLHQWDTLQRDLREPADSPYAVTGI